MNLERTYTRSAQAVENQRTYQREISRLLRFTYAKLRADNPELFREYLEAFNDGRETEFCPRDDR